VTNHAQRAKRKNLSIEPPILVVLSVFSALFFSLEVIIFRIDPRRKLMKDLLASIIFSASYFSKSVAVRLSGGLPSITLFTLVATVCSYPLNAMDGPPTVSKLHRDIAEDLRLLTFYLNFAEEHPNPEGEIIIIDDLMKNLRTLRVILEEM
jgi:hypothetical protein